ncbi:MAG: ATP synthase F1 subunit epsilon [Clostridium butyricum]|nr:ATP synthase F1 subunit epsilon [Clostridium butyricum]
MANTFLLRIVTPSHDVYNGDVQKVFLKNADGELEILANHERMIMSTVPHVSSFIDEKGNKIELFISTSIVKVSGDEVVICSDAAEFAEDIDFERAEAAKVRAQERLKSPDIYDKDLDKLSYLRAVERLKLKK